MNSIMSKSDNRSAVDPQFKRDIIACFSGDKRAIPARWLYDYEGSKLFDAITDLPEYYPTRIETALLANILGDAAQSIGPNRSVVEFGAGSVTKTPLLLSAVQPSSFVPIDISGDFLRSSVLTLQKLFPKLQISPVEADFMRPVAMSNDFEAGNALGFFPGSTIGNMVPMMATDLLRSMRSTLGDGAMLMIGFDRIKDLSVLLPAYDDSQGITAAFNLNLLTRINRELGADIGVDRFRHKAIWNDDEKRVEMHLLSLDDCSFTISGTQFSMKSGETIHTENSHKYNIAEAQTLLRSAGWSPIQSWSDEDEYFSIILAQANSIPSAP